MQIMKKILMFSILMGMSTFCHICADPITLLPEPIDDRPLNGIPHKSPINPPSASLDGHTFYINGEHSGYTLYLIDNSGDEPDVVYQVVIPAGVNAVVLPATLSGTYELQLHNGGAFYFYAEIILS
jgi:hypothetical protein